MEESPYYVSHMHYTQYEAPPPHPRLLQMSASSPHLFISPPPPPPPQHETFPPSSNNSQHAMYMPYAPPSHARQVRRYKTVKRIVEIPQGKLVLNCPVPIQYLERVPLRDPREFNIMRYTGSCLKGKKE